MNTDWVSWLAAWLATYALHSTLLLTAAWALTRLPALRAPRSSEVVWRAALFGGVLTACLHVRPRRAALAGADRRAGRGRASRRSGSSCRGSSSSRRPSSRSRAPRPKRRSPRTSSRLPHRRWHRRAPPGCCCSGRSASWPCSGVDAARDSRLAEGSRRPTRRRGAATCIALRRRLADEAGVARPVRLTAAPSLASPVALGARHLEICLPERALTTLDRRHLEAILAHEVAHLARRDPVWLRAYRLVSALLFFQPLNLLARVASARRVRAALRRVGRDLACAPASRSRSASRSWRTGSSPAGSRRARRRWHARPRSSATASTRCSSRTRRAPARAARGSACSRSRRCCS